MGRRTYERIEIVQGDITHFRADAIVNAANPSLLPGLGVCGAIHGAAGHRLAFECAKLGGCRTGQAKLTPGFRLPARFVIHTVGPIWKGGVDGEPDKLASCYESSLRLAVAHHLKTIAFPSVSTGIYGYPVAQASLIALRTTAAFLESEGGTLERVTFVCFSESDLRAYRVSHAEVFSSETERSEEEAADSARAPAGL